MESIDTHDDLLVSLIGSKEESDHFFTNEFGRSFVHFSRNHSPLALPPPLIGIDMESLYESNEFISLRIRGSRDLLNKDEMSYAQFTEYIGGGGSAIVPIIHTDYMNDFKIKVEDLFQHNVSMNVYHSGPRAVALNIHYDAYDVFVLQLEGKKEWTIQSDGTRREKSTVTDWRNVTMSPGDVLYIPEGVFHAACTAEGFESTTHVTIGLEKRYGV